MTRGSWIYRFLALLWMAAIYWLSSRETLPIPDLFLGQDKIEHAVAFGILALLLALSFGNGKGKIHPRRLIILALLVTLYGFSDEVHQYFVPGRDASFWDFCADATGSFLTAFCFLRRREKTSREEVISAP